MTHRRAVIQLYCYVALCTFGHAWTLIDTLSSCGDFTRWSASLAAAAAWPFYWSAFLWSHL